MVSVVCHVLCLNRGTTMLVTLQLTSPRPRSPKKRAAATASVSRSHAQKAAIPIPNELCGDPPRCSLPTNVVAVAGRVKIFFFSLQFLYTYLHLYSTVWFICGFSLFTKYLQHPQFRHQQASCLWTFRFEMETASPNGLCSRNTLRFNGAASLCSL